MLEILYLYRKRIPPTGCRKLNLEESQNKSACQKYEILLNFPFFQEILTEFHIKHCAIHDVDTELLANGNHNPAWTLNETIWNKIVDANKTEPGLARRYVHNANFENAHKYNLLAGKDKPLQAYKFVNTIKSVNSSEDCLKWLNDYLGKQVILHDMTYIRNVAKSLPQIDKDKLTYKDL